MNIAGIGNAGVTGATSTDFSPEQVATRAQFGAATRAINDSNIFGVNNELTFAIDRSTQHMVFKVVDRTTHDVVMQLPPESVLRLAADLQSAVKSGGDEYSSGKS
jgi:uncharacterized FlaG/YvyC family protein